MAWGKPMTVVVRFRADQAPYVREREWHPTQRFRTLPDGRLEMTFRAGGAFEIVRWVLGWGDAAEVVRPVALRREIATLLKAAIAAYAGRSPSTSNRLGTPRRDSDAESVVCVPPDEGLPMLSSPQDSPNQGVPGKRMELSRLRRLGLQENKQGPVVDVSDALNVWALPSLARSPGTSNGCTYASSRSAQWDPDESA